MKIKFLLKKSFYWLAAMCTSSPKTVFLLDKLVLINWTKRAEASSSVKLEPAKFQKKKKSMKRRYCSSNWSTKYCTSERDVNSGNPTLFTCLTKKKKKKIVPDHHSEQIDEQIRVFSHNIEGLTSSRNKAIVHGSALGNTVSVGYHCIDKMLKIFCNFFGDFWKSF